jgi:hypothetical protein
MLAERHMTDRIPLKMREWSTMKIHDNKVGAAEFTLSLLKGVTRLCAVVVTFEGPPAIDHVLEASDDQILKYKQLTTLFFPPGNQEEFEWWIQVGDQRMPQYACRALRETFYRARLGNCHGPLSRQAYLGDIKRFGGYTGNSGKGTLVQGGWGRGFYTYIDTEKLCGEADMTGLDTKGGTSIYAFFRNMFSGDATGKGKCEAAYIHTNYVKMVSLSASGVEIEE